ncbi:hypothetical protein EsH8_VIII_001056 [Colletotrichum jinshuiense]
MPCSNTGRALNRPSKIVRARTTPELRSRLVISSTTGPTAGTLIDKAERARQRRRAVSTRSKISKAILQETTPTARELGKTGVWATAYAKKAEAKTTAAAAGKGKGKGKAKPVKGDKSRVNIVDEKLCDDILKYIGPTLERHVGCDLVDINPGAGVWSRKLQELLQPRSHILMEPDEELYRPFLEPVLARPGARLIPQSGILWKELNEVLGHIPNQTPRPRGGGPGAGAPPERNDTLLVTANLAFYPKKRYRSFESVAQLVLFQLVSSIRSGALFQRYGRVRMLVWAGADDQRAFLARNLQGRRKSALEAEFACEWLAEVAGGGDGPLGADARAGAWYVRDRWIDVDSTLAALRRMREAGFEIPEGRKTESTRRAEEMAAAGGSGPRAGVLPPHLSRPYIAELEALEAALAAGKVERGSKSKEWRRLTYLRHQTVRHEEEARGYTELLAEMYELGRLRQGGGADEAALAARERAWDERVRALGKNFLIDFRLIRDNLHIFRQEPAVMLWDRRPFEPLAARAGEFFPNVECCLLDIQPKAMHRLLRETGPGTSRAGDMFELIQRSMMAASLEPVSRSLERIWPGASEGILPHCPSLRDPDRGGLAGTGHGEVCARVLNERQWMELLEAFMAWPFRPTYEELIGRLADDVESGDDDAGGGGSSLSTDAALA